MTSERTQQLMLFQTSERYLARVAAALQHKAGQEAKVRRCADWLFSSCACLQLETAFGDTAGLLISLASAHLEPAWGLSQKLSAVRWRVMELNL